MEQLPLEGIDSLSITIIYSLLSSFGFVLFDLLVTGWAQSAFYAIWIRAGDPKPQPGTQVFVKHRKRINIIVVLAYLLYTIYEADFQLRMAGNFYQDLGVGLRTDERGLQSRFRRLTLLHHPDKVASDSNRSIAEAYYVHLKLCRDILVDPTKRFAYDRLGPEILAWQKSTTIPDYMTAGIRNLFYYYTGTAGVLTIIGFMGYIKQAAFWRFLALASLGVFELHCLMSPEFPRLLTKIVNPVLTLIPLHPQFLPFQLLSLLRKLILTLFIAFSQIGPLLTPSTPAPPSEDQIQQQQLQRLGAIAGGLETQANMLMALEMTPFTDESDMRELRERLKRFLVDNTIRSNKEVRDAMGGVLARRRQGVPHGAAGTR
ncbi:membrane associated DnaJ chaperone-like protein [Aureobasidium pullulans]|nr:membrane associated DnaJ chaperone-like protein [Aureobasidium pullulans]